MRNVVLITDTPTVLKRGEAVGLDLHIFPPHRRTARSVSYTPFSPFPSFRPPGSETPNLDWTFVGNYPRCHFFCGAPPVNVSDNSVKSLGFELSYLVVPSDTKVVISIPISDPVSMWRRGEWRRMFRWRSKVRKEHRSYLYLSTSVVYLLLLSPELVCCRRFSCFNKFSIRHHSDYKSAWSHCNI